MGALLARRLAQSVVVVVIVATATFFLMHLAPGDPFAGPLDSPLVSTAAREQWRADFGLDRPLPEQYVRYMSRLAQGDFGFSLSHFRPVGHALRDAIPNTLLLMGVALLASFVMGVLLGIVQALRRRSIVDRIVSWVALFFYSVPDFWLAIVAVLIFAYWLRLLPAAGMVDPVMHEYLTGWARMADLGRHLLLPAATLTALSAAAIARYQRAAMLEVMHRDFVRTARAKGASERRVVLRHVLRNALLPVITLVGLSLPALFGGAAVIEMIFAWPGMGYIALGAIGTRDYPLITATVIVVSVMVCIGSILADMLYALVDPRLREE